MARLPPDVASGGGKASISASSSSTSTGTSTSMEHYRRRQRPWSSTCNSSIGSMAILTSDCSSSGRSSRWDDGRIPQPPPHSCCCRRRRTESLFPSFFLLPSLLLLLLLAPLPPSTEAFNLLPKLPTFRHHLFFQPATPAPSEGGGSNSLSTSTYLAPGGIMGEQARTRSICREVPLLLISRIVASGGGPCGGDCITRRLLLY